MKTWEEFVADKQATLMTELEQESLRRKLGLEEFAEACESVACEFNDRAEMARLEAEQLADDD